MSLAHEAISYFRSQVLITLPVPTKKFTDQIIIVTGANVGLGLEAARHFVRLDAAKVIIAARSMGKGTAAAEDIAASTGRPGVAEPWELDLASYVSIKAFAKRAGSLERLDAVVHNAGVYLFDFSTAEENETTITVNVVGTMLLALLLLPKQRETSLKYGTEVVVNSTGSFVHYLTKFPERKNEKIFEELAKEDTARMEDRYNVSKMINLLVFRELAAQITRSKKGGRIVVNITNPGFVRTSIMRHAKEEGRLYKLYLSVMVNSLARPTEEGSRVLVNAAEGGEQTHGQYLDDCRVGVVSNFVTGGEGAAAQAKLWKELSEKLENIHPGVMQNI